MLERDDLTNRFGRFKGLGRVKTEFGTVDCPQVDQTGLAKEGQDTEELSRFLVSQSQSMPLKSSAESAPALKKNQTVFLTQKIGGKNVRTIDINTKIKQNALFCKFQQKGLPNDKFFYPNPIEMVHPLRTKVDKKDDQTSSAQNGTISLPKIQPRLRLKGMSQINDRIGRKRENSLNRNPFLAQRTALFTESRQGEILPKDQFNSIYETSFNQANQKFKKVRPSIGLDNVKDLSDLREIKSPFSYEEVSHRIHGISRGTFGQPF